MLLQYAEALCARHLVLASASPRRREILGNLGLKFDVVVSRFDEDLDKAKFGNGGEYAMATAQQTLCATSCRMSRTKFLPDVGYDVQRELNIPHFLQTLKPSSKRLPQFLLCTG